MESKAEGEAPSSSLGSGWPSRRGVLPPIGSQTEQAADAAERGSLADGPAAGAAGAGAPDHAPMMKAETRAKFKQATSKALAERALTGGEKNAGFVDYASSDHMVKFALLIFIAYLAVGAVFYALIMDHWTVREALYFGVVTLTTVGYGDLCPKGDGTKAFTILFALVGVSLIGSMLGLVGQLIVRRQLEMIDTAKHIAEKKLRKQLSSLDQDGDGKISLGEMTHKRRASHDEAPRDPDARPDAGGGGAAAPRGEDAGERACRACGEPPPWLRTLATTFAPIVACALVCALVMHKLEGWSFFHAFYYAIITGASIGYGDFYPVTKPGQWFAVFFVPLMVVVFAAAMGQIGNAIVQQQIESETAKFINQELTFEQFEARGARHEPPGGGATPCGCPGAVSPNPALLSYRARARRPWTIATATRRSRSSSISSSSCCRCRRWTAG